MIREHIPYNEGICLLCICDKCEEEDNLFAADPHYDCINHPCYECKTYIDLPIEYLVSIKEFNV